MYINKKDAIQLWIKQLGAENAKAVYKIFDILPKEDVAKNRHGSWKNISRTDSYSWSAMCSVCGNQGDIPPVDMANYCPFCGAKMDLPHLHIDI